MAAKHRALLLLAAAALLFWPLPGFSAPPSGSPKGETGDGVSLGAIDFLRTIEANQFVEFAKPRSVWGKLLEWVAGPAERPWLGRPYALTEDSLGRLIVADPAQGVIHILDFERRRYQQIARAKNDDLLSPVGVAVDAEDNIYVSDSARARIYVFNKKGKFLRQWGESRGDAIFKRPTGLALDPARERLYVTDTLRHQVLVLDLKGVLLATLGQRGTGPGEFNFPTALALAGHELYVVDAMNFRIQVFTPEGEFVRSFGGLGQRSGTLNRPKGIGVDSDGHLYVVDAWFESVQVFDPEGRLLYYFGATGDRPGEFALPSGIYINPGNHIYVADSYNQRIQVFRYRRVER